SSRTVIWTLPSSARKQSLTSPRIDVSSTTVQLPPRRESKRLT
ncbi:uncharacterized protein METZ01_LOCUS172287, partial [marine metagenome]